MGNRPSANFANENISQNKMFIACNMVEEKNEDIWFLDSRCSNHMTRDIAMFSMLDENVESQVTLGTDSKVSVMGKGKVSVLTKKGEGRSISDVYYVPDMKCSLLSIGQLIQNGYNVFFEDDVCIIMDKPPRNQCIAQVLSLIHI